eukprot:Platyproteum_vivax@DN7005_c0_g2_i1.p1
MFQVLVILLFVFSVAGRLPQVNYKTLNEFNGVCSALYGVHFNNFAPGSSESPNYFEKDFIKLSNKNENFTTEWKFGHLPKKIYHKVADQEKNTKASAAKEVKRILESKSKVKPSDMLDAERWKKAEEERKKATEIHVGAKKEKNTPQSEEEELEMKEEGEEKILKSEEDELEMKEEKKKKKKKKSTLR